MNSSKLPHFVLLAAIITTCVQAAFYGPGLPDQVASHFGANGVADGGMDKAGFLAFMVGMQIGLTGFLYGLAMLLGKLPASMLNIPNKEYWLHEDRRALTIETNQKVLVWITAITAVFMVIVFQLCIQANLGNAGEKKLNLPVFICTMIVYLFLVFGISAKMILSFAKTPAK